MVDLGSPRSDFDDEPEVGSNIQISTQTGTPFRKSFKNQYLQSFKKRNTMGGEAGPSMTSQILYARLNGSPLPQERQSGDFRTPTRERRSSRAQSFSSSQRGFDNFGSKTVGRRKTVTTKMITKKLSSSLNTSMS